MGYYCPYEDNCPFDDENFEECEKCKKKAAIFEDTVESIVIEGSGIWINTNKCRMYSQIGAYIFLTNEETEAVMKERESE